MDLIDRQAAIDFIDAGHLVNPNEPRWSDNEVVAFLKSRPSAEKTGKWVFTGEYYFMNKVWRCNQCGWEVVDNTNYCPNCGARMEEL